MDLRNRHGTAVDPVPFLVASSMAFAICYAWGPVYFLELGLGLRSALVCSTVAFVATVAASFYRLVWTARPDHRSIVPFGLRFRRLVYAIVAAILLLVALLFPLYR